MELLKNYTIEILTAAYFFLFICYYVSKIVEDKIESKIEHMVRCRIEDMLRMSLPSKTKKAKKTIWEKMKEDLQGDNKNV